MLFWPSKLTVLTFVVALKLSMDDTNAILMKAVLQFRRATSSLLKLSTL